MRKAIAAAESGTSSVLEHNVRLIHFYEAEGIEFLGDLSFGKDVGRPGARWKAPPDHKSEKSEFHTEKFRTSFAAARGLFGVMQSVIAEQARLPVSTVSSLELGSLWPSSSATLQKFYMDRGVEFLGWEGPTPGLYYGVGVRWTFDHPTPTNH